jgi:hypothetical protein
VEEALAALSRNGCAGWNYKSIRVWFANNRVPCNLPCTRPIQEPIRYGREIGPIDPEEKEDVAKPSEDSESGLEWMDPWRDPDPDTDSGAFWYF